MKKMLKILMLLPIFILVITNCNAPSDSVGTAINDSTTVYNSYLSGQVVDASSGNAIANAIVRATSPIEQIGANTNSVGSYSIKLNLTQDSDVQVVASAAGYSNDTTNVFALINQTYTVPTFKLKQTQGSGGAQSGKPASINLFSQSTDQISVKEAGGIESAQIIFEIFDSNGVSIDLENAVTVNFEFGDHPNGGEYIFPTSVKSNTLGRASLTLNSGTKAGVVQIQASFTSDGKLLKSLPVLISIHGGLPDDTHFSIATSKFNIPAVIYQEYPNLISAFVGDKYANPVKQGTSVYFTTDGGFIQGSTITNVSGIGSVNFITASPVDVTHPTLGAGFFTITGTTADENKNQIKDEIIELFSFGPILTANPTTFDIKNGGSASFVYTCMDANGNPMSLGQSISVSAEGGSVTVSGDSNINMPDTQSKSWTSFGFTVSDGDILLIQKETVLIKIETTGSNGAASLSFSGTAE